MAICGQEDVADVLVAVVHRSALEGCRRKQRVWQAVRAGIGAHVIEPHDTGQPAQVFEQPPGPVPVRHLAARLFRETGKHHVLGPVGGIDRDDDAVARSGHRTGVFEYGVQHAVELRVRIDAPHCGAQPGGVFAQRLDLALQFVFVSQLSVSPLHGIACRVASPGTGPGTHSGADASLQPIFA